MTTRRYGINETTTRTDASYIEPDDQRRARLIVQQSKGAPGVPSGDALDAIERNHRRRISEGAYSKPDHSGIATASGAQREDEATEEREDEDDALRPNESVSQREQRRMNERIRAASQR
jgi:hypothetical protein